MEENNQNPNLSNQSIQNSSTEQIPAIPPPPTKPKIKLPILISVILFLIAIGLASLFFLVLNKTEQKACTLEVKICPDGSSVGRTGPNCEFAPCPTSSAPSPTSDSTTNWKTYTNNNGFSIKYPASWIIMDTVVEDLSCALLGKEIVKSMTICFSTEKFSNVWPEYINNPNKIKITINGYDAYENTISPGAFFVLNSNEQFASISPAGLSDKKLFDQILSTFRF